VDSDFKFETEYLLDCSIPNKPPGEIIFLEDCLYDYFTNVVQVRRELFTLGDQGPMINRHTKPNFSLSPSYSQANPPPYVGDGNGFYGVDEKAALKKSLQPQQSNVTAWQVFLKSISLMKFFKLLPYYVDTSGTSEMAVRLANERPMLGICLKRYGYDTYRKQPYRNGRR
jgi:hypothetical protein